jgi:hypothetical protein
MDLSSEIYQTLLLEPGVANMSDEKHYIDEIGTDVIVDCGQDISTATVHKLEVRKPDGTTDEWDAEPYTIDDEPNYLIYTTISGDFDQAGLYSIQSYIEMDGWEGRGQTVTFEVFNNYDLDPEI